jgi:hypothetical protein
MEHRYLRYLSFLFALAGLSVPGCALGASVDLRLPSDATGGGTLAVRATFPDDPERFRYGPSGGAPVVVLSPGGFSAGGLDLESPSSYTDAGLIVVTFFYPGGGPPGIGSDGVYDERGDLSQRAFRDVVRFAAGDLRDTLGRTLSEVVDGTARTDLVGILALSNGGSIAITTLGRYGDEIPPLAFLVSWESPSNDQVLGVELGTHDLDPDPSTDFDGDGVVDNDVRNGAYRAYGFPQLDIDYARLAFDPDATIFDRGVPAGTGLFYFDNDGDGVLTVADPVTGSTDANGNGALDADEDFPLPGISHTPAPGAPSSRMLSRAAAARAEALERGAGSNLRSRLSRSRGLVLPGATLCSRRDPRERLLLQWDAMGSSVLRGSRATAAEGAAMGPRGDGAMGESAFVGGDGEDPDSIREPGGRCSDRRVDTDRHQ